MYPSWEEVQILQQVFSNQEGQGAVCNFRSVWPEHTRSRCRCSNVLCLKFNLWLVSHDRAKLGILLYQDSVRTQEVPQICFWGSKFTNTNFFFFQSSFISMHLQNVHGCSSGSSVTLGHLHMEIHPSLFKRVGNTCQGLHTVYLWICGFWFSSFMTHKLSWDEGSVSGFETPSLVAKGLLCLGLH